MKFVFHRQSCHFKVSNQYEKPKLELRTISCLISKSIKWKQEILKHYFDFILLKIINILPENIFLFDEIAIFDQKQLLKFSASSNKDVFKYVLCY